MTEDLLDLIRSLVILMEEETARLSGPGRYPDMAETAQAKVRLVASLEAANARLNRENPHWMETLADEERDPLREAVAALRAASEANAAILKRQIELSNEMMAAVTHEARRVAGTRSTTYGSAGNVQRVAGAAPISINTQL
jgi:flagellar biosynthesis/type III secretory pathway chaperone